MYRSVGKLAASAGAWAASLLGHTCITAHSSCAQCAGVQAERAQREQATQPGRAPERMTERPGRSCRQHASALYRFSEVVSVASTSLGCAPDEAGELATYARGAVHPAVLVPAADEGGAPLVADHLHCGRRSRAPQLCQLRVRTGLCRRLAEGCAPPLCAGASRGAGRPGCCHPGRSGLEAAGTCSPRGGVRPPPARESHADRPRPPACRRRGAGRRPGPGRPPPPASPGRARPAAPARGPACLAGAGLI